MTATVFIDGEAGTTGLQIRGRLQDRTDITLLTLEDAVRKDPAARKDALASADISILCLPEDASREAVALSAGTSARLIDASIAYRTDPDWVFGFAEYNPSQRAKIAAAGRVTNPGCYACGSIAMLHPLVTQGLIPADFPVTLNAVSGYSGGGRKLIEAFEKPDADNATDSAFYLYALGLEHKHIEEIRIHSGLTHRPVFVPSVGRFAQGMIVSLPLQLWALPGKITPADLHAALAEHYAGDRFVAVASADEAAAHAACLDPQDLNGANDKRIYVFGNAERQQAVITAVLDNLGKGAAGQAVQNLNLMLGLDEGEGL